MSAFWNWWIALLTAANVAFALWLLRGTMRRQPGEPLAGPDTTGHTWDGDLQEFNNPLPRWWLWVFYLSIAFALAYLVLFPGIGVYDGTLGWSQTGQWRQQTEQANAVYAREFGRFASMPIAALEQDAAALRTAKNLFAANCSTCHGSDARGAKGFPNLTSPRLSWGRTPEAVVATISDGRQGVMPAWKDVIGADGVAATAAYVYSLSGRAAPPALVAAGKDRFATVCAACHAADGTGNPLLGAPDLTDAVWIYGSSLEAIQESIANGRSNRMPAHLELLGEQRVRLLAAYVLSLASAPEPAAGVPPPHASGT